MCLLITLSGLIVTWFHWLSFLQFRIQNQHWTQWQSWFHSTKAKTPKNNKCFLWSVKVNCQLICILSSTTFFNWVSLSAQFNSANFTYTWEHLNRYCVFFPIFEEYLGRNVRNLAACSVSGCVVFPRCAADRDLGAGQCRLVEMRICFGPAGESQQDTRSFSGLVFTKWDFIHQKSSLFPCWISSFTCTTFRKTLLYL